MRVLDIVSVLAVTAVLTLIAAAIVVAFVFIFVLDVQVQGQVIQQSIVEHQNVSELFVQLEGNSMGEVYSWM